MGIWQRGGFFTGEELVQGGFVTNGATPSSFCSKQEFKPQSVQLQSSLCVSFFCNRYGNQESKPRHIRLDGAKPFERKEEGK